MISYMESIYTKLYHTIDTIWNDRVSFYFCEGRIHDELGITSSLWIEEPSNAISSLLFCVIGYYGLFRKRRHNISEQMKYTYTIFTICGLGSFLFHSHFIHLFRYMDEIPMVLLGITSAYTYSIYLINNNSLYYYVVPAFWQGYGIFILSCNPYLSPECFRLGFGIPMIYTYGLLYSYVSTIPILYKWYMNSLYTICLAFLLWNIDVWFCNSYVNAAKFHMLWHILIGYSANTLIELSFYFYLKKEKNYFHNEIQFKDDMFFLHIDVYSD